MPDTTSESLGGQVPPIIDADWLRARLASDDQVAICHVGSSMAGPSPVHDFEHRHLPNARFVSLDDVLAAAPAGTAGRHPLPSPADFAAALGELGIADNATVVAYDDRGGAFAGRFVWMLRILGQHAALLDGGIEAWLASSTSRPDGGSGDAGEVEHGPGSTTTPVDREVHDWPLDALVDAIDVARHLRDGGVVIDSRDPARYAGDIEPIDSVAGHIPGAINLLFSDNLDSSGRFMSPTELRARFEPFSNADADADDAESRPIVHCGSGVTACHNALAMEHAGLGLPRVYVGSWSGWTADPDRPIATGNMP
jgi:thiosulfate/3-mercaptopyruvate sulfurtransferase